MLTRQFPLHFKEPLHNLGYELIQGPFGRSNKLDHEGFIPDISNSHVPATKSLTFNMSALTSSSICNTYSGPYTDAVLHIPSLPITLIQVFAEAHPSPD